MLKKLNCKSFIDFYKIRQVPLKAIMDFKGQPMEKILKYWRLNELVPFMEKGQWARISFAELIWLRMLDSLRQLHTPIETMKVVCKYLFEESYADNLPEKNLRKSIQNLEAIKPKEISEFQKKLLSTQKDILENHKIILELLKSDVNYLTNLIHIFLNDRVDCGVAIFSDMRISEVYNGLYIPHNKSDIDQHKPHIYLSMRNYLREFIEDEDLSFELDQILNDNEVYVLNLLKNKNLNEINIEMNNGKTKISYSLHGTINKEQSKTIKSILGINNYDKITLSTRDGNSLSFKRTKMKFIDSD